MDGDGSRFRQRIRLALRKMDAVAEQAPVGQKVIAGIDVGIVLRLGIELRLPQAITIVIGVFGFVSGRGNLDLLDQRQARRQTIEKGSITRARVTGSVQ